MSAAVFSPEGAQRVPVVSWNRALAPATLRQLRHLASQPWVVRHVAAMADAHVADGVAVGTVFATEHHVVPAAIGGDIGCGMSALRFDVHAPSLDRRRLAELLRSLGKVVPVGARGHDGGGIALPEHLVSRDLSTSALTHERDRLAPRQLGTLGGGNHFLELDRDGGGALWALVHSGSRGMGGAIRAHHGRAAEVTDDAAIPALDARSAEGRAYLDDLQWALDYARESRRTMMLRVREVLADTLGAEADEETWIDIHHNFVASETHDGEELWVHRKGAVHADVGERALIPGSMGTASFVVEGRGEPTSFCSCSHGAGRVMSRRDARNEIGKSDLTRAMGRVVFDERRVRDLIEEAPQAYRDIAEVLEDQEDLVTRTLRLSPIAVLKG